MKTLQLLAKLLKQRFPAKFVGKFLLMLIGCVGLMLWGILKFIGVIGSLFAGTEVEDQKDGWMRQHRGGAGGINFRGRTYTDEEASRKYNNGDFYDRY